MEEERKLVLYLVLLNPYNYPSEPPEAQVLDMLILYNNNNVVLLSRVVNRVARYIRVPACVGVDGPTQSFITRASSPRLLREPFTHFPASLSDVGAHSGFTSSTLIGIEIADPHQWRDAYGFPWDEH